MQDNIIFGTDYQSLSNLLEAHKIAGKKIVITSGTYDLFHYGHMAMVRAAKEKGDILIVAVKSDKGASLKKEHPPIMTQTERMKTLSLYPFVDYVIMVDYSQDNKIPDEFEYKNTSSYQWLNMFSTPIGILKPHIFVHEDVPSLREARKQLFKKYGIEGVVQPRTSGVSSSDIIDRIVLRYLKQM